MNENGYYLVMWKMVKHYPKKGLLNWITGKRVKKLMPMMHKYENEEIARYGYYNIKKNGGIDPRLVKVLQ